MALRRAAAATFEPGPDAPPPGDAAAAQAPAPAAAPAAAAPAPAPAPAPTPAAAPAPAATPGTGLTNTNPRAGALATPASSIVSAINQARAQVESYKDALPVNWDTLKRIKFNTGQMVTADGVKLGEWIDFELLSYQDNWLISPGADTDEARDLARYSDDGVHVKDSGELCSDYIARLKTMNYPEARMSKRLVLVLSLIDCDKDATVGEGDLFQIDAPPTTKQRFETYQNQAAFNIAKQKATLEQVGRIRASIVGLTQKGTNKDYSALEFKQLDTVVKA